MKEVIINNLMHVFICVNERENKTSCFPTISLDDYRELKKWCRDEKLINQIFITKTGCLGQCNVCGGVMCIYPQKKMYTEIKNVGEIKKIILEEYKKCLN